MDCVRLDDQSMADFALEPREESFAENLRLDHLIAKVYPWLSNGIPSKVLLLTNRLGSIQDNESGGLISYRLAS